MPATRATNTMSEGLPKLMNLLGQLKLTPDADVSFLNYLEGHVIGYVQAQAQASMGAGQQAGPGVSGTPGPPAIPPDMGMGSVPSPGGPLAGPPPPGVMPGAAIPPGAIQALLSGAAGLPGGK